MDREDSGLQPVSGRRGLLTIFAIGIALNLGNPKMPLFYVALLLNVVGASLNAVHLGVLMIVRRVNRAAGGVMIGAGVAVVAAR